MDFSPDLTPKIGCSRPKLSTPRPQTMQFWAFKVACPKWGPPSQQIRGGVSENGPVAAKMANRSSRPAQIHFLDPKCRLGAGREFQIASLGLKWDLRRPQKTKVVYPPPSEGQIQGICDGQPKIRSVRPVNIGVSRSSPPNLAHFGLKTWPQRAQMGYGPSQIASNYPFLGRPRWGWREANFALNPGGSWV
jgi:hypothetical protein